MHTHFCDVAGHHWECSSTECECLCGLRMEEGDHSDCPVELRACPEHPEGSEDMTAEPASDAVEIDFSNSPQQQSQVQCNCGCAEIDAAEIVGWCLWCSHVYSDWAPALEDEHFAHHCPGVPEKAKLEALESLAKRNL